MMAKKDSQNIEPGSFQNGMRVISRFLEPSGTDFCHFGFTLLSIELPLTFGSQNDI